MSETPEKQFTLSQLAAMVDGEVVGDGNTIITGISTLQAAQKGDISFLANPAYEKYLKDTLASVVILSSNSVDKAPCNALVVNNPYLAYATLSHCFAYSLTEPQGVHQSAVVDPLAIVDASAVVAANAVIEKGAVIGANVIVGAGCFIGENTEIGEDTRLYANVSVYHGVSIGKQCIIHSGVVIGADGFGIAPGPTGWNKIAQIGGVVIGDNVEVGANTTIDRGALDNTIIENGVKLDNQIQIAHNVIVGENTAIAACAGIAGSTRVGKGCVIGGGCGLAGHLTIADNVHLTGMTLVTKSIKKAGVYSSGTAVEPNDKWRRNVVRFRQLDELANRVKKLEKDNG
ncbi:UDP-3-O-(3-hydroxymyristoyl)glucosamine N-acyltransferase [Alkalimarinus sediminis]|uniref:UDP-3-O-acylglucosamine N-acyltransferase n=1 Tax=Alkalimarinus sediminis TaxID=1632866 RepID=A0A9E8KNM8_9ALTE|nr:UDP-3-O-(3-hydroxymyristoyl)glucosamine N-acyltransferase [Alkalimarinus sediminis]UZW73385.1 UDP-3-O-(3-hydroxymyristoyl)glucosamine N-acyltransferase [Alkalimarinus sediminis]